MSVETSELCRVAVSSDLPSRLLSTSVLLLVGSDVSFFSRAVSNQGFSSPFQVRRTAAWYSSLSNCTRFSERRITCISSSMPCRLSTTYRCFLRIFLNPALSFPHTNNICALYNIIPEHIADVWRVKFKIHAVRRALLLLIDNIYKHIDRFICLSINKCAPLHRNQSLKQEWKVEYKKLQRRKYVVRTTARRPWPAPTPTRLALTRKRSRISATVSAQEWEIWKGRVAPSSVPASSTVWQQKTRSKP